jgi:hypothetical protein
MRKSNIKLGKGLHSTMRRVRAKRLTVVNIYVTLKKWRKAREECMIMLCEIKHTLEIERRVKFFETPDQNDPPIQKIPEDPIFEEWETLCVAVFDINFYGFGSWENMFKNAESLSKKYNGKYLEFLPEVMEEGGFENGYDRRNYYWYNNSFCEKLCKNMNKGDGLNLELTIL